MSLTIVGAVTTLDPVIPDWLDAESLRTVIVTAIAVLAVAALMVMRFVRRALIRMAVIALLGALALGLWVQRTDLQDCVQTCSCRLFGQDVAISADRNPNCE